MAKLITDSPEESKAINIKIVGIGNAGSNIISRISEDVKGITSIIFNTDANALTYSKADIKIRIGEKITKGSGTGRDPEKGKFAANEDKEKIKEVLDNSDFVFLVAGLGGGTGTGSSPVIAKIAKDLGAIVIAFVTTPFAFEGDKKIKYSKKGLEILENNVDTLIHLSNKRLYDHVAEDVGITDAFGKIDEIISRTIESLSNLIYKPKIFDIDFADICSIVSKAGKGIVGLGSGKGENRVEDAANNAIDNPLVEKNNIMEAKNILISLTGSKDLTLREVGNAMNLIERKIASPSKVIGVAIDENLENEIRMTILATGIGDKSIEIEEEVSKPVGTTIVNEIPFIPTEIDINKPAILRGKEFKK